jgi:hypothetical protein
MLIMHKWCWCKTHKCVVEVLSQGHFPTTAIVRLPNDKKIEVEIRELENSNANDPRS